MRKLSLINFDQFWYSNPIDPTQELWCFKNQDLISSHPFELDQYQNFENHVDILASYPFPKIELGKEYDLEP